jgi:low affinity Fe/Cu permease
VAIYGVSGVTTNPSNADSPAGIFRRLAHGVSWAVGTPVAFLVAVLVVIGWAISGPLFGYSDTWQLVINTGTTIITFLMVFLIQNSQNRDSQAIQLKLDELIRVGREARNDMINLEDLSEEDLARLHAQFEEVRHRSGPDESAPRKTADKPEPGASESL